jgi:hypothetical protein
MSYWRIIPDKLIDWIEQTKNPERYARLILLLIRLANWGDGIYSDGIEVKRGQIRITGRKLAQRLGYSKSAVNRLLLSLQKAGWVELSSQNNLTIISLLWLTQPGHLEAFKRDTQSQKVGHQAGHDKQKEQRATTLHTGHQAGHDKQESGTPESGQAGIRSIRNIEVEEDEVKEDKNTHIDAGEGIDLEEVGEKLKNLHKRVREEIELRQVTDLTLSEIEEAAGKIRKAFVKSYKKETGNLPAIRAHEYSQLKKLIAHSCPDRESLNEWLKTLLERIEAGNYWRINNSFISKNGRSFYTFVHTIPAIMEGQGRSLTGKGENKVQEAEVKPW